MKTLFIILTLTIQLPAAWIALTEKDNTLFPNPERGFYLHRNLAEPNSEWESLREKNITLLWGKIDLTPYREKASLPQSYLDQLQKGFDTAAKHGLKVIIRASYGHKGPDGDYKTYRDPAAEIIATHIKQLAPLWQKNAHLIAFFEAGYLGPWGEWHSSQLTRDKKIRRNLFLTLMAHTPKNRMVVVRYPSLKRDLLERRQALRPHEAYLETTISRTGHHNDCFLSSESDVGTYGRSNDTREEESAYLAQETLHTLFGGETCASHNFNDSERTLKELSLLHATYLNKEYHPEVLKKWQAQNCYSEISRRLGPRFTLKSGSIKDKTITLTLENLGFASLYNARPAFLVLDQANTMKKIPLNNGPRLWKPAQPLKITQNLDLSKVKRLGLWLPDQAKSLRNDPRYALRLANQNTWDKKTGINWIFKKDHSN